MEMTKNFYLETFKKCDGSLCFTLLIYRTTPVSKSLFDKVAGLQACCVNIVVFWIMFSTFIRTKQICIFSFFSYHRLKVLKNRSRVFSFFSYFTTCSPIFYNLFYHFLVKKFCIRQYHLMFCCFQICTLKYFSKGINVDCYISE